MYQLTNFTETASGVSYTIVYTFDDGEQHKEYFAFATRQEAFRYYAWHVHEFLRFRFDDFKTAVRILKPYYFDKTSVPYMLFDGGWRAEYYRFQYGVCTRLEKLSHSDVSEFARLVTYYLPILKGMIPATPIDGQKEIKRMYEDIQHTAGKVLLICESIHKNYSPLKEAI
jgi:hypothetical protein